MNVDVKSDVVVFYEEQLIYPFDLKTNHHHHFLAIN